MSNMPHTNSAGTHTRYLISIEPGGSSYLCCGETDTVDLYGDTIIGTVEAKDEAEALRLGLAFVPEQAITKQAWRDDPASMGLSAHPLA